jgi:hypothetical protein
MKRSFAKYTGGLLLVGALVSACDGEGPGNSDAYQKNSTNCSSEFVLNYNQVTNSLSLVRTESDLRTAESLVDQFSSKYKGVACVAELSSSSRLDDVPTTIVADSKVSEWKGLIARARGGSSSSSLTPSSSSSEGLDPVSPRPSGDRLKPLSSLSVVTLEIQDAYEFNRIANSAGRYHFQKGAAVTTSGAIRSLDICAMAAQGTVYQPGDKVRLKLDIRESVLLGSYLLNGSETSIACLHPNLGTYPWTLDDLDRVFGGVAKVSTN